ncbi:MAG: hypothetical protein ACYS22_19385 [Planctomycetota bacterium]
MAYAESIRGRSFDSCANEAVISGRVDLRRYSAVLWMCGEEATTDEPFSRSEQQIVNAYLQGGGNLLVSGAEIGWDLDRDPQGDPSDIRFFRETLKAAYAGDDAGTYVATPAPSGLFTGLSLDLGFYTPGEMTVSFPDQLTPRGGATACLNYVGGQAGVAGIRYRGAYGLVHLGFPFESIDNRPDREAVMERVLADFGL